MPEIGQELSKKPTVTAAPKVILTLGDQPSEMAKFTPYTGKGESYRMNPVVGDITDALMQARNSKKLKRDVCSSYLARRYASLLKQTNTWADMTLDVEAAGVGPHTYSHTIVYLHPRTHFGVTRMALVGMVVRAGLSQFSPR